MLHSELLVCRLALGSATLSCTRGLGLISNAEENGMQTKLYSRILGAGKITLAGAGLAGFLLFTGAPGFRAGDDECQKRISRWEHHLHEAVATDGPGGKQADKERQ